jgi:hypothetical protein
LTSWSGMIVTVAPRRGERCPGMHTGEAARPLKSALAR